MWFGATDDGLLQPSRSIMRVNPTVKTMQLALQSLAARVGDSAVATSADGIVGPNTLRAVNRALPKYTPFAPPEFRTGKLTSSKVTAYASQITSYLNKGGSSAAPAPNASPTPVPAPASAASFFQQMTTTPAAVPAAPGGAMNPNYYQPPPPAYYPQPQGYYPQAPRAGGLPTDRATLDVRAFIPAQYQHVRLSPVTGLLLVGGGLALIALIVKNRKLAGK